MRNGLLALLIVLAGVAVAPAASHAATGKLLIPDGNGQLRESRTARVTFPLNKAWKPVTADLAGTIAAGDYRRATNLGNGTSCLLELLVTGVASVTPPRFRENLLYTAPPNRGPLRVTERGRRFDTRWYLGFYGLPANPLTPSRIGASVFRPKRSLMPRRAPVAVVHAIFSRQVVGEATPAQRTRCEQIAKHQARDPMRSALWRARVTKRP